MKTVSPEFVDELIDFAPTEDTRKMGFADAQRDGTVALFNMLQRNKVAYLADEVGMGKTYVALGVMALVRYFDPHARIVVIAPLRQTARNTPPGARTCWLRRALPRARRSRPRGSPGSAAARAGERRTPP